MSDQRRSELDRVLEGAEGAEYDEDVFQYLLSVEQSRASHASRPLRLLFATLEPVPGKPVPIPPRSASKLFDGLRTSLRETDVMGWYRQGRVAGAVLTAKEDPVADGMPNAIERRVGDRVRHQLPAKVARSLRVRVIQLGPRHVVSA